MPCFVISFARGFSDPGCEDRQEGLGNFSGRVKVPFMVTREYRAMLQLPA